MNICVLNAIHICSFGNMFIFAIHMCIENEHMNICSFSQYTYICVLKMNICSYVHFRQYVHFRNTHMFIFCNTYVPPK